VNRRKKCLRRAVRAAAPADPLDEVFRIFDDVYFRAPEDGHSAWFAHWRGDRILLGVGPTLRGRALRRAYHAVLEDHRRQPSSYDRSHRPRRVTVGMPTGLVVSALSGVLTERSVDTASQPCGRDQGQRLREVG
jgi:hypothetical protein